MDVLCGQTCSSQITNEIALSRPLPALAGGSARPAQGAGSGFIYRCLILLWHNLSGNSKRKAYLASREWGLLKQAVRERAKNVCEMCRKRPVHAVHHLTYERLYRERLDDLLGVCNGCHEYCHGLEPDSLATVAECAQCGRLAEPLGRTGGKHYCEPCSIALDDLRRGDGVL